MQRHILVPLDGSELAETVLPHAIALARATGSMLTVVLVVAARPAEPLIWPGNSSGAHGTPYGEEAVTTHAYLEQVAARLQAAGVAVRTEVLEGDPATRILARAGWYPSTELIAMATHGRSGLDRWIVGSVAEKVLHAAPIPLLLVRGAMPNEVHAPVTYRTILVALDGSRFAEQALDEAKRIAAATGAAIVLMSAIEAPPPELMDLSDTGCAEAGIIPIWTLADRQAEVERITRYLAEMDVRLRSDGLQVRRELAYGKPADAILTVAHEQQADLLVLATHGRTGMERLWLGSVALTVVHRVQRPVLLVRATERAQQRAKQETSIRMPEAVELRHA
jgi:nucleotide-binding universal stress UspA family protein